RIVFFFSYYGDHRHLPSFPTRRSSDLRAAECEAPLQFVTESYDCSPIALPGQHQKQNAAVAIAAIHAANIDIDDKAIATAAFCRSEEHTSELQSLAYLVCRLLLEKKKN